MNWMVNLIGKSTIVCKARDLDSFEKVVGRAPGPIKGAGAGVNVGPGGRPIYFCDKSLFHKFDCLSH